MHVRPCPSAESAPMLMRYCTTPKLADAERRAAASCDGAYPLDVWQCYSVAVEHACCAQFELIVRPRLARAPNEASICPRLPAARRYPPSTGRRPLVPARAVHVASFLCSLMPTPNMALSNDAGSPLDWPSCRAYRTSVPPRSVNLAQRRLMMLRAHVVSQAPGLLVGETTPRHHRLTTAK
ncbi:hypothetical protein MVEN_00860700 [Mycena venus]|uniref:Uncharacterized protein n=1 Tax=Mycena venus TaxID=2733690 RepID=A0A8H6YG72_9AGAR|nr:hypothetical protein MVEN_00860700 [Mycena venus]